MTTLFLKPKNGARVLDPDQRPPRPLPETGARVTDSLYWRRKINEGVAEIVSQPKPSAAKKAKD